MDPQHSQELRKSTETSYAKLRALLDERNSLANQVTTLHLQAPSKNLVQQTSSYPKQLHAASKAYAKACCQELSQRLLALPRELRDIVYTQLWNQGGPPPLFDILCPDEAYASKPSCPGPPCTCLESLPHFVDVNYMGRQVAAEALQTCKKVASGYILDYTVRGSEIEGFATADTFHVGVTREEIFRGLDLTVSFGNCVYGDEGAWALTREIVDQTLRTAVRVLLEIPFEEPRIVTFDVTHDDEMPANLSYVMSTLASAFHGMREKGFDVRLQYKNSDLDIDWELGVAVWDWTVEEWMGNMRLLGDLNVGFTDHVQATNTLPPFLMEEEFEKQEDAWKIIMRDLYHIIPPDQEGVDLHAAV